MSLLQLVAASVSTVRVSRSRRRKGLRDLLVMFRGGSRSVKEKKKLLQCSARTGTEAAAAAA